MELFLQFNQVGVTLLIATHDVTLIERLARRTLHLGQGRLVSDSGVNV